MLLENENQHHNELSGLATNLLGQMATVSASRLKMWGSQLQQALVISGCTRDRFWTGPETEYGKYTFKVEAKFALQIVGVVEKFQTGIGVDSFKYNPKVTYIVKNINTGEFDVMHLDKFCSHHNNFGFEHKLNQTNIRKAQIVGNTLKKGDVLAQSPTLDEQGIWRPGLLTMTCTLSSPYVTEDGFLVSDTWCQKNRSKGIGTISITVPKGHYLLNTYGNEEKIKLFPGPGEAIREDGLLIAMRKYDDILGAVELSPKEMMEVDYYFDEKVYIEAHTQNARVIDVEVWRSENDPTESQPVSSELGFKADDDISRYTAALKRYYSGILSVYDNITREAHRTQKQPKFSDQLRRLVWYSSGATNSFPRFGNFRTSLLYNGVALNSCRIVIRYTYDIIPTIGFKTTGRWGDKGVICKIKPEAEMPVDQYGNIVEVASAPVVTINRMNPAKSFEHYHNFKAMEIERTVRAMMQEDKSPERYLEAHEYLMRFYKVISPLYWEKCVTFFQDNFTKKVKEHVDSVVNDMVYIYLPEISPNVGIQSIEDIEAEFPSVYGPVAFINEKGELRRTKKKVMVGANYMILLEKTGHDWSAVDAPRRQVHGVPSKMSQRDRHGLPWRFQAIRFFGESEVRNYAGILGGEWIADMLDRANNPKAQYMIYDKIISSERNTDLDFVIDRNVLPTGNNLAQSYMNNHLYCAGAAFAYKDVDQLGTDQANIAEVPEMDDDADEAEYDETAPAQEEEEDDSEIEEESDDDEELANEDD